MGTRYFSGTQQVQYLHSMKNAEFASKFPGVKGKRLDSFSMLVAHTMTGPDEVLPVTRIIDYKKNPSLHKCDSRCRNATGHNCECSCGGQFHGAG